MPAATTAVGASPRTKTRARHTRACTLKAARRELLELITAAPADEPRLHQHLWRTMHPLRPSAATRPPSTTDTAVGGAGRKELPPTGRDAAAPWRATELCNLVPSANSSAPRGQPRVRNPNHRQVRRARALRRPSARSACKLVPVSRIGAPHAKAAAQQWAGVAGGVGRRAASLKVDPSSCQHVC